MLHVSRSPLTSTVLQVSWQKIVVPDSDDTVMPKTLTLDTKRLIHDYRFTVAHPDVREWNLHISGVERTDQGHYLCTINTSPPQHKKVVLYVKGNVSLFNISDS